MRDAAALVNVELLPWDVRGAMPGPGEPIAEDLCVFFDRLAALTADPDPDPDANFAELARTLRDDERVRVPGEVHNVLRGRDEAV